MNRKKRQYKELGDVELSEEITALVNKKITEAEADIKEIRINFRWGSEQLEVVKRAAALMGVPYQTYIKQIVFRQSIQDLNETEKVLIK